jgi:phenylalanyl-tRNA synthetase beta chain
MDFFDMKGVVEGMLDGLNITDYRLQRSEHTTLHPGRSAALLVGETLVGNFGELHPRVAQAFDLTETPVFVAEFDLEPLLNRQQPTKVRSLPVTPPVLQDIALVVDADTPAVEVEAVIRKEGGDPIPEGKKSIAYSLTYQTDEKTLTDKEVAKVHKKIVKATKKQLGAELRS